MWTPGVAGGATITLRALKDGLRPGSRQIFGAVAEDAGAPAIQDGGIVNIAHPVLRAPASPGAIVSIRGRNLAPASVQAEGVPLPRKLGDTTLLLGGIMAPLFSVSPEEIRAQVPAELAADQVYSVAIWTGERVTTPKKLRLAQVSPGILADGAGRAQARHPDLLPVTTEAPVKAGGTFVLLVVGMGPVSGPLESGAPSPESPSAVQITPAVTLGGMEAQVVPAQLKPGEVGIYEVTLIVPEGLSAGDHPLVLTQQGVAANTVIVPVGP
jgi:uncharacterized protein (TIGR03437 family)